MEEFYRNCADGKLVGTKCKKCGAFLLPPRPMCRECLSSDFEAVEFSGKGTLLTYTVIHIAAPAFQSHAPYILGIVKLDQGPSIPGMIMFLNPAEVKIGQRFTVDFAAETPEEWPSWPRYFFRPLP